MLAAVCGALTVSAQDVCAAKPVESPKLEAGADIVIHEEGLGALLDVFPAVNHRK